MVPSPDHALGVNLASLIREQGDAAFESGVISRRILAQVQDILGPDTTLATPLRDLLSRPAFRLLLSQAGRGQNTGVRDALLTDLREVYSAAVVRRLTAVLNGCLGIADTCSPGPDPEPSGAESAPARGRPVTSPGRTSTLIPALSLISGGLLVAMAAFWFSLKTPPRSTALSSAVDLPESQPPSPQPGAPAPSIEQVPQRPVAETSRPNDRAAVIWQACLDYRSSMEPQNGRLTGVLWSVVGPVDALPASRRHCRRDALRNSAGRTQIASFKDRDTALAFAEQLSRDTSHPYRFEVEELSSR